MKKLFLLLFLLWAVNVNGATYWVDAANGNNGNGCNNSASPLTTTAKASIQNGINCLTVAGDTLYIRTGSYTAPTSNPTTGSATASVTISNYNGEIVTVNGVWPPFYASNQSYIHMSGTTTTGAPTFIFDNNSSSDEGFLIDNGAHHVVIEYTEQRESRRQGIFIANGSPGNNEVRGNWIHDNGTHFQLDHNMYIESGNNLVERNRIYNGACYGIQLYNGAVAAVSNNIIRYNEIYSNGQKANTGGTGTCGGMVLARGTNNQVYRNIVRDNIINSGGIQISGSLTNSYVFNNTLYNNSGAEAGLSIASGASALVVKNNVIANSSPVNFIDNASGVTKANNFCTTSGGTANCSVSGASPGFVNPAFSNFSITSSSPLFDAGTSSIAAGITLSCAGNCDIGVFEVPKFSSCSAVGNTLSLVFDNPSFPPLANISATGILATIDSTLRTNSAPVLVGTNQVNITFSGAAVSAAASSQGTGGGVILLSDSANIGGLTSNVQRVSNWSSTPCTVTPTVGIVLTQTYFRFHDLPGLENSPKCLSATGSCSGMQNIAAKIQAGGCFRCRVKIACTGASCGPGGYIFRDSRNGGGYTVIPDAFAAENIKYYGTSDTSADIPSQGTVTTEQLTSDQSTNISGSIVRTSVAIPNLNFTINSEAELEGLFCVDRDEPSGTTHALRVYNQNGSPLDAYNNTATFTVVSPALTNGVGVMSKLDPWDMQIILGSNLTMGKATKRTTDTSSFVYPTVPKSARVIYIQ